MPYVRTGRPNGRPPSSAEQKARIGNPGGLRGPTRAPLPLRVAEPGEPPEPHRPLGPLGRGMWDRLIAIPWIVTSDLESVLLVCEQVDERGQLRVRVLRDGHWRDRSALRQIDAQIGGALGALGLDPSSRARMNVGSEPAEPDELQKLRAKREQYQR